MYCKWPAAFRLVLPAFLLALLFTACRSNPAGAQVERLAILRFENLSGDASMEWAGRGFSELLSAQVPSSPERQIIAPARLHSFDRALGPHSIGAPGISSEATQAQSAGATQLGYGTFTLRNGKLEAQLTLESVSGMKTLRVLSATAPAGDLLGAATALAAQLTAKPQAYGTSNARALAAFMRALETTDPAVMEAAAGLAIAADPDYAGPYRLLAQARLQQQDRAGALAALDRALQRGNAIPELERVRIELEVAELNGNSGGRQAALGKLVKLDGTDPLSWIALGEGAMSRHQFRASLDAFRHASELQPEDGRLFNSMGYAAGEAGDLDAGMKALRRFQALRPNDVDAIDSMGDIHVVNGRLSEAENFYLEAARKNPAFLNHVEYLKAAMAHLWTGDASGANNLAEQYLRARGEAKDPALDYRRAQWTWISGRRKAAAQQMGAFALSAENGPARDLAARAYAEMSLWSTLSGDRDMGGRLAQKALSMAGPGSAVNAVMARYLAQPSAGPAVWAERAAQQFPSPAAASVRNTALVYALLLERQFQPAQLLLQRMWDGDLPGGDEGLSVLLGWTLLETGKTQEAAALLRFHPVPAATGLTPFTTFYLPRLLYLRGQLADQENRRDDARGWYDKFLALSGPTPLIWGEEKKVRP